MAARDPKKAPAANAAPPAPFWRKVRENAEAVIIAIVLALIIRHYSLEAFEIPTGSMAPGLHGVHVVAECPNCGTHDEVSLKTHPITGQLELGRISPGYIYDGPCLECGNPILDGVTRPDAAVRCPHCRTTVRGDPDSYRRTDAFTVKPVRCHECLYEYRHYFEPSEAVSGHKILVNKFAYETDDPERWQVIVFKFNRQRNYIKRLIGLPGERIRVVDGDIHINGEVERKPREVQATMWFPVHDTDIPELGLAGKPWLGNGAFDRPETGGFSFNALDGLASLTYQRPIRNLYGYNGASAPATSAALVRDLRALVDLRVDGVDAQRSPRVWVDIRNDDVVYRLSLPVGGDAPAQVLRVDPSLADGEWLLDDLEETADRAGSWSVFAEVPDARLSVGGESTIDFSVVDRQVRVIIDGVMLLERPVDGRDLDAGVGDEVVNTIALHARHAGGVAPRIQLFRDIHYTRWGNFHYAVHSEYQIPDDGYFAMGDNSPSSLDSRAWGALSRQNLLGRGFAIFWPALPGRFQVGFIH